MVGFHICMYIKWTMVYMLKQNISVIYTEIIFLIKKYVHTKKLLLEIFLYTYLYIY